MTEATNERHERPVRARGSECRWWRSELLLEDKHPFIIWIESDKTRWFPANLWDGLKVRFSSSFSYHSKWIVSTYFLLKETSNSTNPIELTNTVLPRAEAQTKASSERHERPVRVWGSERRWCRLKLLLEDKYLLTLNNWHRNIIAPTLS